MWWSLVSRWARGKWAVIYDGRRSACMRHIGLVAWRSHDLTTDADGVEDIDRAGGLATLAGCRTDRPAVVAARRSLPATDRGRLIPALKRTSAAALQRASGTARLVWLSTRQTYDVCKRRWRRQCRASCCLASYCRILLQTTQHCFSVICSRVFLSITDMQLVLLFYDTAHTQDTLSVIPKCAS